MFVYYHPHPRPIHRDAFRFVSRVAANQRGRSSIPRTETNRKHDTYYFSLAHDSSHLVFKWFSVRSLFHVVLDNAELEVPAIWKHATSRAEFDFLFNLGIAENILSRVFNQHFCVRNRAPSLSVGSVLFGETSRFAIVSFAQSNVALCRVRESSARFPRLCKRYESSKPLHASRSSSLRPRHSFGQLDRRVRRTFREHSRVKCSAENREVTSSIRGNGNQRFSNSKGRRPLECADQVKLKTP